MKKLITVAVVLSVLAGCNMAKKNLQQKFTQKIQGIENDLDDLMTQWFASMSSNMPKANATPRQLLKWRQKTLKFKTKDNKTWREVIDDLISRSRGLSVYPKIMAVSTYFNAMDDYWNGKIKEKEYVEAFGKLKKALLGNNENKKGKKQKNITDLPKAFQKVITMTQFDQAFIHFVGFVRAKQLSGLARSLYLLKFWTLAFDFPRRQAESVDHYLSRLCKDKLSDFCSKVPFEYLGVAMLKPYYEKVLGMVTEFRKQHPNCKLNQIFKGFQQQLADAIKKIPPQVFKEDPVLPDTVSKDDFTADLFFRLTEKNGLEFATKGQPRIQLLKVGVGWKVEPKDWRLFKVKLTKLLKALEKKFGPENTEWVMLISDKNAPVTFATKLVAVLKSNLPRYISFAGRRHKEGIAKAVKVGKLAFREVPIKDMKLSVMSAGKTTKFDCKVLGQTTTDPRMDKKLKKFVLIRKGSQYIGDWNKGKTMMIKEAEMKDVVKAVRSNVSFIAISANCSIDRLVQALTAFGYKCKGEGCYKVEKIRYEAQYEVCW